MRIAVVGCAHGELEDIYGAIQQLEKRENIKIDLLICCGDFQATRNENDLKCMAVPPKYAKICTFYKYYSGVKEAPVLTIFVGGNHEASNYLQELPYGGWVAPGIYYMGYAGVVNVAGLRIAGLSGIYKSRDYMKGRYEKPPYDESAKRTVYHIRNLDVFRLKQLSGKIDIFLSHDWPSGITQHGNLKQLLKRKPFFKADIESNQLGSAPCGELLSELKPKYWFAAHLHCKFAALVKHDNGTSTKFLALDKCLPKRRFLQVVNIPHTDSKIELSHDLEWLTTLFLTNHLLEVKNIHTFMPGPGGCERYKFTPDKDEKRKVLSKLGGNLRIPKNFTKTAPSYKDLDTSTSKQPPATLNPQTVTFCETLCITDPVTLVADMAGEKLSLSLDESFNNSTFIDDTIYGEVSLTPESTPSKRLGNLSLPEPKLTQSQDDNGTANDTVSSDTSSVIIEENTKAVETAEVLASPSAKKLKRRNESLYKTEST